MVLKLSYVCKQTYYCIQSDWLTAFLSASLSVSPSVSVCLSQPVCLSVVDLLLRVNRPFSHVASWLIENHYKCNAARRIAGDELIPDLMSWRHLAAIVLNTNQQDKPTSNYLRD